MAGLSASEVKHVARLARLELSSEEVAIFKRQLSEVVDYMGKLKKVDISGNKAITQTTELKNVLRSDEVGGGRILGQEEALSGTESVVNGYFEVPALIDRTKE